ncbi:hypothetical protein [Pseudonocardia spirodelae]|uniref:Uncharacterized protein n=1 Tax=Pseudonocardia spirodelae TaxID=3133431 RepID=A0ABU8T759_9PSEU
MSGTGHGCGHGGVPEDLRATAVALLDRLRAATETVSESLQAAAREPGPGDPGACTACPVCALLAVVRGERSELATRLAEQASGLLALLVAVLEEAAPRPAPGGGGAAHGGAGHAPHGPAGQRPPHGRTVQRIVVRRT